MLKNKFIRLLVILNGVMLPMVIGLIIYAFVDDFLKQNRKSSSNNIYESEYEAVKVDYKIANTGPMHLFNSDIWFVSVYRYYDEDQFRDYGNSDFPDDIVNIIFLDEALNVKRTLLDDDFLIISVDAPNKYSTDVRQEGLKNFIFYLIVEEDTNSNGILDKQDVSCLYMSTLDGSNFRKIVNKDVSGFRFVSESEIALAYKEQGITKYGVYNISENHFKESKVLNSVIKKYNSD
ncbi:hypothetical protein N1F78_14850 [Seonamhaeicola sp. MEBiC1930]|uniref:hypothetical protein n=1 Tax=Seonamhaeicola sp. MEBiC01930 TaxID=2976768 RepID=UPI003249CFC4